MAESDDDIQRDQNAILSPYQPEDPFASDQN